MNKWPPLDLCEEQLFHISKIPIFFTWIFSWVLASLYRCFVPTNWYLLTLACLVSLCSWVMFILSCPNLRQPPSTNLLSWSGWGSLGCNQALDCDWSVSLTNKHCLLIGRKWSAMERHTDSVHANPLAPLTLLSSGQAFLLIFWN